MRRPGLALTLLWLAITLPPWAAWWATAAPSWFAVALLFHAALFFGLGYLSSGRWGYGAALALTVSMALTQGVLLGNELRLWACLLPSVGLLASLGGALLWRWRVEHYGADFHFDLIAPWYERFIHPQHPQELLAALQLSPEHRVLDIGGGTGRVAQFLQPARLIVVVDISTGMLRLARKKPGLAPTAARAEALPFPNGTFERAVMVDALHHLFDQRDAVTEMWRVLRPGGRMVIEEPDLGHPAVKLIALWEKAMLMRSHFLYPEAIADLLPPEARVTITRAKGVAHIIADKPST